MAFRKESLLGKKRALGGVRSLGLVRLTHSATITLSFPLWSQASSATKCRLSLQPTLFLSTPCDTKYLKDYHLGEEKSDLISVTPRGTPRPKCGSCGRQISAQMKDFLKCCPTDRRAACLIRIPERQSQVWALGRDSEQMAMWSLPIQRIWNSVSGASREAWYL